MGSSSRGDSPALVTMKHRKRVAVAMSGGLDSSVAAALLLERGYRVEGLTMRLWREASEEREEDGLSSAQAVCEQLGVRHDFVNLRGAFLRQVVDYFVNEYARGRTPNPCVQCNRFLKFGLLLEHARELGCDLLATGHYARIERAGASYRLLCGMDSAKDQSYFLYMLRQEQLRSVVLPLGELTKAQVRALARERCLPVLGRDESQDLCFLRGNDYHRFLATRMPGGIKPGPIYDTRGRCLGEHRGLPFYTVGQREGLGISAPGPLYVIGLDVSRNALTVGSAEELGRDALLAEEMSYVCGQALPAGDDVEARIRYRARSTSARVWPLAGRRARIVFDRPLRDITPGQAVVLYRGEQLLGGGIISRSMGGASARIQ